jgi:hypothetical protein
MVWGRHRSIVSKPWANRSPHREFSYQHVHVQILKELNETVLEDLSHDNTKKGE